jgi:hypothetical protein
MLCAATLTDPFKFHCTSTSYLRALTGVDCFPDVRSFAKLYSQIRMTGGHISAALLLGIKPISLVSSPRTDQSTVVEDGGSIVSLSIRTDPNSLSTKAHPVVKSSRRGWRFPYFPPGEFIANARKWPKQLWALGLILIFLIRWVADKSSLGASSGAFDCFFSHGTLYGCPYLFRGICRSIARFSNQEAKHRKGRCSSS